MSTMDNKKIITQKIKNLIISLQADLTIYEQLFGSEKNVQLMNEFNSNVFDFFHRGVLANIFMQLARLFDPPKSNLSLKYLISLYGFKIDSSETINNENLVKNREVQIIWDEINNRYSDTKIKKVRNKLLSHNDLKTHQGKNYVEVSKIVTPNYLLELTRLIHQLIMWLQEDSGEVTYHEECYESMQSRNELADAFNNNALTPYDRLKNESTKFSLRIHCDPRITFNRSSSGDDFMDKLRNGMKRFKL